MNAPSTDLTDPAGPGGFAAAVVARLPAAQAQALARCAVVTLFDPAFYDAALRPGAGPDIAELLDRQLIEAMPGADDVYRVALSLQDAAWESWFEDGGSRRGDVPAALKAVAEQVERYCATTGRAVERLRALLLIDQDRATVWFVEAFDECDARFDLAGCANLVGALCEPPRFPFIGPRMAQVRDDRCRYLTARGMWRSAFLSSDPSRYLPRAELEATLETLLDDVGPRLLRLHGSGGYGKSTLLRWFIARRCVPGRIPCALVDLDGPLDPVNATRHPWLLILEIAHQLNGQMEGTPFQELLREYGSYRTVLAAGASVQARTGSAAVGTLTGAVDADEITNRFLDALRDAASPRPVLIVFDTIEEAMLRPASDTATLMVLLRQLRTGDTGVRLVVSGRFTRAELDLAASDTEDLAEAIVLAVPPFSPELSAEYLRSVRQIANPELVTAIIARAGGLPWQLAVWGDVVQRYPTLTVEMLTQVQPEIAWVVDRIVGRIEDDMLQWLVRYGVVPRRLRRDFAEQVILPRIARALAGSVDDRPALDARPQEAVPVFRTDLAPPSAGSEFDELWHQLTRYAATTSWMWLASGDENAVVFHPEVREPMRKLVAAQPVGELLHQDAARYYTDLAARDPDRWASWTCEALYHRFRSPGSGAAGQWRAAVAQARRTGLSGDAIAQLAGEVLGPEYVDELGRPLPLPSGEPVIDVTTLAAAHAERAWALARIARRDRLPGAHPTWSQVESSLAAAELLGSDPESDPRRRSAQAALDLTRGAPAKAVDLLESVVAQDDEPSVDRCIALVLLADALAACGRHEQARQVLLAAGTVADRLAVHEVSARIAVALAEAAAALGRIDEAVDGLQRAVNQHRELAKDPELRRTWARYAIQIGRPVDALQLVFRDRPQPELGPTKAEAEIAVGNPDKAELTCSALLAEVLEPEQRAAVLVLRAQAGAELLHVDQAVEDLARAREVYVQLGDAEGAGTCTGLSAGVLLHGVGNLREAQQHLDEGDRLTLEPGSPAWARCRLLRAELEVRLGSPAAAVRAALEALDTVALRTSDPRQIVDVALAAFCWAPGLEPQVIATLQEHLPRISPDTARLTALTALTSCPRWSWGEQLRALTLPAGRTWKPDAPEDAAMLDLRAAELMRVAGHAEEAVELVTAATSVLATSSPLAGWTWLQAIGRVESDGSAPPGIAPRGVEEAPAATQLPDRGAYPLLAAAQALTLARRRLDAGNETGVRELIAAARTALTSATPRTTWWHGRLAELRHRLGEPEGTEATVRQGLVVTATLRELGYPAAEAASAAVERPSTGPVPLWTARELTLRALLDAGGELVVSGGAGSTTLPAAHPLVAGLHEEARTTGKSAVVRWVREQMDRPTLTLDGLLDPIEVGAAVDLRVSVDPPLAQLPWELIAVGGHRLAEHPGIRSLYRASSAAGVARTRVRMLQEALAATGCDPGQLDGLHGPDTARALAAFQRRAGIAADGVASEQTWDALRSTAAGGTRAVLVVSREPELEPVGTVGSPANTGAELEEAYTRLGWQVRSVRSADLAHLDEVVGSGTVDVVHVNASMQVTGAVPYLGFGADTGEWSRSRSESVTCSVLDAAVRQLAQRGNTPLVVLDVAGRPYFGSESVRQLLLRNDFAHQLLALGQCYAVLATGLAPQQRAAQAQERLLRALTDVATAADLARALRPAAAEGPDPGDLLPWAATALFAAVPPTVMPSLNRPSAG